MLNLGMLVLKAIYEFFCNNSLENKLFPLKPACNARASHNCVHNMHSHKICTHKSHNKGFYNLRVIIALFFFSAFVQTQAQLLPSIKPVLHFRTDCFDIYAPQSLEADAKRLAGFADNTYGELCEFLGLGLETKRIPVLLSDIEYSLNGFSTLFPSNRIVLLLSAADPRDQLATFEDELYSVFLHELVHYVTLNERSLAWRVLAWLGGDWIAPEIYMMPQAIVEGTAVWVESRFKENNSGRLNDPAAMEFVRLERARRENRSLWDVSGLEDFYGAGSLPYLYGGLFVDYLSERFGKSIVARLWQSGGRGNIYQGFVGGILVKGILERETGIEFDQLWQDFLAWVDEESDLEMQGEQGEIDEIGENSAAELPEGQELFSGYIGALGAGGGKVYFVDLERHGLYQLSLVDLEENSERQPDLEKEKEEKSEVAEKQDKQEMLERLNKPKRPERLFAADQMLRNIYCDVNFGGLELDWNRINPQNQLIPARYLYDLSEHKLSYEKDLPQAKIGEALFETHSSSKEEIFLHYPWQDPLTSIEYGLVRLGTAVLPARRLANMEIEVADIPDSAIRWLSQGFRDNSESSDSICFALSLVPDNGLSRLAILEQDNGLWRFAIARKSPLGGVHMPVFADASHIVYKASSENGQSSLLLLDISSFRNEIETPGRFLDSEFLNWISPTEWIESYSLKMKNQSAHLDSTEEAQSQPELSKVEQPRQETNKLAQPEKEFSLEPCSATQKATQKRSMLFPESFETSRIPYAYGTLLGIGFIAMDLTERLSWSAFVGWDWLIARPASSIDLSLSAGAWRFEICAWDQGIFAFPVARISALEGALDWEHTLVPTFRSISAGIHARYGAVQNKYEEQGLFHQSPDYFAWVAGTGVEFDSLSSSYRPPYDPSGISLKGGIEYEGANSLKFGGVSLSGSIYLGESTIAGRIGASIYGAWAPTGGVAFSPATRYLEYAGDHELSVADLPYPAYKEYQACSELSAWYLYGEIKARLFSLELNWIMSNLFAPSLALRRISMISGLRGAGLEIDNAPYLLSSAFLQAKFDCAFLSGVVAATHMKFTLEAAWAFQADKTGGEPFCFSVGLSGQF